MSCAMLVAMPAAHAEKGGKGKGQGNAAHGGKGGQGKAKGADKGADHPGKPGSHGGGKSNAATGGTGPGKGQGQAKKFDSSQRAAITSWYRDSYTRDGNCPPGLAKKGNGCQPPGQAKRWSAGSTLPGDVYIAPVPSGLRAVLAPPLAGYEYGWIDGGVALYSVHTRVVVDFVFPF
jgi:hypothetical protein